MESSSSPTVMGDLTRLIHEDIFVQQIVSQMRSGAGCPLDAAVEKLKEFVGATADDPAAARARIDQGADKIRQLSRLTAELTDPRGLTAGGRPSWYPGPREDDLHWPRLKSLLQSEGWDADSIREIDTASTKVVAHCADPFEAEFNRKGLVLGYVQSGKTTNFTAVIAKAADAGYSFFIVLSGVHNGLRQQTQGRLDQQLFDQSRTKWHRLTGEEDFRPTSSVDAMLSAGDQKVLAVVKKNASRLRALKRWLGEAHEDTLARCPLLIIDDEADQASINTAKPDGSPTSINRLIRQILAELPRVSYIGYTATPFANVLIDPGAPDDLYPKDFIIDLPQPREYVGPETLFGREALEFDDDIGPADDGHDLIREIPTEEVKQLKPKGASDRAGFEPVVAPSLAESARYFLLSTAARRVRNLRNRHATMLVHTSQYTLVHASLRRALQTYAATVADRLATRDGALIEELREQWERESGLVGAEEFTLTPVPWEQVLEELPTVVGDLKVIEDNSRSEDRLDYSRPSQVIIAVGGNTLSRGLTLEGLSVSYFVRTASAYDTLLQMGRWFGYRKGYADLTRIWMTDEMRGWFRHLATVEQEIRYEIERYEGEHRTPTELAIRIRTHPKLAITAAAKMQDAVLARVSYSGRRLQTILFDHKDAVWLDANLEAGRGLIRTLREIGRTEIFPRDGLVVFRDVESQRVIDFLAAYNFHENSRDLKSDAISAYIRRRLEDDELRHFSVAIAGLPREDAVLGTVELGLEDPVPCVNRARLAHPDRGYADIKALMSRGDRVFDFGLPPADVAAMSATALERGRDRPPAGVGDGTGLLALYPISKHSEPRRGRFRSPLEAVDHVLGVGLVFPTSDSEGSVDYYTADLSDVEREEPGEADEIDEDEEIDGA
ncbi:MAG TPA: Z1 domain-containing protein [Solirubrobacterales bacterium]|nr:Z1 domain-containing protein [Solirubrobacterales bacterium]